MNKCDFCKQNVNEKGYTLWVEDENGKIEYLFGHEMCSKKYESEVLEF